MDEDVALVKGQWKIVVPQERSGEDGEPSPSNGLMMALDTPEPITDMASARRQAKKLGLLKGTYTVVRCMGLVRVRKEERAVVETVID